MESGNLKSRQCPNCMASEPSLYLLPVTENNYFIGIWKCIDKECGASYVEHKNGGMTLFKEPKD